MNHALIIDDNLIVSQAVQSRLRQLGFETFDHAWTQEQAIAAANNHIPGLIVVGDYVDGSASIDVAKRLATEREIPVLMLTTDPNRIERYRREASHVTGPFLLNEIDAAVDCALGKS